MYTAISDLAIVSINSISRKLISFVFTDETFSRSQESEFTGFLQSLTSQDMMKNEQLKDILRDRIYAQTYNIPITKEMATMKYSSAFAKLNVSDKTLPIYFADLVEDRFYKQPDAITNELAQSFQHKFKFQVVKQHHITLGTADNNDQPFASVELENEHMDIIFLADLKEHQTYEIKHNHGVRHTLTADEINKIHKDFITLLTDVPSANERYKIIEKYFEVNSDFYFEITS